jgi:hypothetical protein
MLRDAEDPVKSTQRQKRKRAAKTYNSLENPAYPRTQVNAEVVSVKDDYNTEIKEQKTIF